MLIQRVFGMHVNISRWFQKRPLKKPSVRMMHLRENSVYQYYLLCFSATAIDWLPSCKNISCYFKIIFSKLINKINWWFWWHYFVNMNGAAKFYWHANEHSMVVQSQSVCKRDSCSAASHTKIDQNAAGTEKRCHSIEHLEDIFHFLVVNFFSF